jgi:hypothetical protein
LRSRLLGACLFGLLLPFQRSAFYFFDSLFPFVRKLSQAFAFPENGVGPYDIFEAVSAVWLAGFLCFFIARSIDYRKTVKMFREGKAQSCASYFYRFRSRIYQPPDFELTYTPEERELIMAHERQHIRQHDPLVYRLLVLVDCACWFNPLFSVAVRHFQHERELLCDEKVLQGRSAHEYGMAVLKAAEQKLAVRAATAGIVMEHGSIAERVGHMLEPVKTAGKITATVLVCLTTLLLFAGFAGLRPAWMRYGEFNRDELAGLGINEVNVYRIDIDKFQATGTTEEGPLAGMEPFVFVEGNTLHVDERGMYDYAKSLGYTDDTWLLVTHLDSIRPAWGAGNTMWIQLGFQVKELLKKEYTMDFTPNDDLYTRLTDILV